MCVPGRPARVGRHEQGRGNGVNPRVGGPLQHAAPRQGGGSRRGGTRPRGRNTDGKWHSHPEGGKPPGNRQAASGSGLPGEQHDGGAIFGQSQERKLGRATARLTDEQQDRVASGKTAPRSGGASVHPSPDANPRDDGPRRQRPRATARGRRPRRTAAKAHEPRHRFEPPPVHEGSPGASREKRPAGNRRGEHVTRAAGRQPAGNGGSTPVDQRTPHPARTSTNAERSR